MIVAKCACCAVERLRTGVFLKCSSVSTVLIFERMDFDVYCIFVHHVRTSTYSAFQKKCQHFKAIMHEATCCSSMVWGNKLLQVLGATYPSCTGIHWQHVVSLKMADVSTIGVCAFAVAILVSRRQKRRQERSVWVRDWIKQRRDKGVYYQLMQELRLTDTMSYRNRIDAVETTSRIDAVETTSNS